MPECKNKRYNLPVLPFLNISYANLKIGCNIMMSMDASEMSTAINAM